MIIEIHLILSNILFNHLYNQFQNNFEINLDYMDAILPKTLIDVLK